MVAVVLVWPFRREMTSRYAKAEVRNASLDFCSPHLEHTTHTARFLYSNLMLGRWTYRPESCRSLVKCSFWPANRFASTYVTARISRGDDLGQTREDDHQTFRMRKDQQMTELPLSPLLDPVILKERSRWEQTKERPKVAEFSQFQKKIWESPFGRQP